MRSGEGFRILREPDRSLQIVLRKTWIRAPKD